MEVYGPSDSGMDIQKLIGRLRTDPRNVIEAIIFRAPTGCQWNHFSYVYGYDSTIDRTFQYWVEIVLFPRLWTLLVEECEEFGLVDWKRQVADSEMGKTLPGGDEIGPNPTDRTKHGSKKCILTDRHGGRLSVVVAGGNVLKANLLDQTIGQL